MFLDGIVRYQFRQIIKKLDKDKQYWHCVEDGLIYKERFHHPLINLKQYTGGVLLPNELWGYNITSGICNTCLEEHRRKRTRDKFLEERDNKYKK